MNLTQLKYFIAVYEERNITAAAKRCFISQPSISNALKEIEEELETKLFVRHKRGVFLTREAHYLYPLAIKVTADIAKLPELFKNKAKIRELSIGIFPNLSPSKTASALKSIYLAVEHLKLSMVNHTTASDARIILDVLKKDDEIFLPLWEEEYLLCAAKEHPLSKLREVLPHELQRFDFIECPSCEAHQQTIGLLACGGFSINIVAGAEDKSQVMHLVQSGLGVSFLPEGVIETAVGLAVVPFKGPRMFRRIGFSYPANKTLSESLARTVAALSQS